MNDARTFTAPVVERKLRDIDRRAIAAYIGTFADGELIDVTVGPHRVRHSDPQRNYWFAVIVTEAQRGLLEQGTRMSKDDVHALLLWELCPDKRRTVKWGQHEHVMRASFADMTKDEVRVLIDAAVQFIAEEFFVVCPEPSQYDRDMRR